MLVSSIPIRLIYHLYVTEDILNSEVIKIHFEWLKHYSSLFSESTFIISVDNQFNEALITKAEQLICTLGFNRNLTFKVVRNNRYLREAETFYNEIYSKLNLLDGLTFFAHSKGISNECNESLKQWIVSMYYFSLNFEDDLYKCLLSSGTGLFFGPNITQEKWNENDPRSEYMTHGENWWYYPGTIYWLNTKRVWSWMHNHPTAPTVYSRYTAEVYPSDICKLDKNCTGYHSLYYGIDYIDWYHHAPEYISTMYTEEDLSGFKKFYKEIIESI